MWQEGERAEAEPALPPSHQRTTSGRLLEWLQRNRVDLPKGGGVYVIEFNNGRVYVGRTNNYRTRMTTWARSAKMAKQGSVSTIKYLRSSGSKAELKRLEQRTINSYGGVKKGSPLLNARNEIAGGVSMSRLTATEKASMLVQRNWAMFPIGPEDWGAANSVSEDAQMSMVALRGFSFGEAEGMTAEGDDE